jgi:hypothetical protein
MVRARRLLMSKQEIAVRSNHSYPMIELVHSHERTAENVSHRTDQAVLGKIGLQTVMAGRAFREYHALSQRIGLNRAGNLRGMVVSARWRTLFRYTSEVGEHLDNLGYLAALASGIATSAPKFESIVASSDSAALKGLKIAATTSTIAQRALLGVVPAGAHMIYRSLEGWCMIGGLVGGSARPDASPAVRAIQGADAWVQTKFQMITDTDNQSRAFWWLVDLVAAPVKR